MTTRRYKRCPPNYQKWAINRWFRKFYEWKKENKTFLPFSELVKYVVIETEIVCDPANMVVRRTEKDSKGIHRNRERTNPRVFTGRKSINKSRSFVAHTNEKNVDQITHEQQLFLLCRQDHDLETCKDYMSKYIHGRKDFVKSK